MAKRVVGMPGDTLMMTGGRLRRNGRELAESYAIHHDPTRSEDALQRAKMRTWQSAHLVGVDPGNYAPDLQSWGPLVVPPDSLFALGDNRDASYDSRYYGFIPFTHVLGRPWLVYFSVDFDPTAAAAGKAQGSIRWSRIGRRVK
jgi:signal peptidase I